VILKHLSFFFLKRKIIAFTDNNMINKPNIVCYCFGQDGAALAKFSSQSVLVETMYEAVEKIRPQLKQGDMVLLSPACASLDQFKNFEQRGDIFMALARGEAI